MGARMRKTLPEDIEQIIASGDVEAVARAVKNCQVGAYLRTDAYKPQLMHFPASQEITEFFLQRGEDIRLFIIEGVGVVCGVRRVVAG